MNRAFPVLMLVLGFVAGTSVVGAYAIGGIDMFADVFVDGTLTVQDGTEGFGKVFTSDGAGTGSWQDLSLPPFDPSGLQTQIDFNDADISGHETRITSLENSSIVLVKEEVITTTSLDAFPKIEPQHFEYICPNNGIIEGRTIGLISSGDVRINIQNSEVIGGSAKFLDGFHGIELDAQRTQDGASFVRVTMSCLSLE